jgi:hypothetical protein
MCRPCGVASTCTTLSRSPISSAPTLDEAKKFFPSSFPCSPSSVFLCAREAVTPLLCASRRFWHWVPSPKGRHAAPHEPPEQLALATEHSPSSSSQIGLASAQHLRPPEASAAPSTAPCVIMFNGRRAPHHGQAYSVHLRPRWCILGLPPHRAHLTGISNHVGSRLMDPAPETSSVRPPATVEELLW